MTEAIAISIGVSIASSLLSYALTPTQKVETNRLSSLLIPKSDYGANIPWVWGRVRVPGNLIWGTKKTEVKKKKKSGKGSKVQTTNYTYYGNFAALFAECPFRPIVEVNRIWFNSKLVYSVFGDAETIGNSDEFAFDYMRLYLGTDDQLPDPLISSVAPVSTTDYGIPWSEPGRTNALANLGLPSNTNTTPAYRDRVIAVFEALPLGDFGNELPGLSAEINAGDTNCKQIVEDICTYCEIDFDADSLEGIPVEGFFVNSSDAAKEYLQVLATAYHFEMVRRGSVLKFLRLSDTRDRIIISTSDLVQPENFSQKIPLAEELPSEVTLTFIDKDLDFKESGVSVKNKTADHDKPVNYNFPVVMSVSEAQTLVNQLLFLALNAESYEFELPLAYNFLELGDEVVFNNKICRINKLNIGANFQIKASAIAFDPTLLTRSWLVENENAETAIASGTTPIITRATSGSGVRSVSSGSGTVYVKDVDYTVSPNGQVFRISSGSIPNNSQVVINTVSEPQQSEEDNQITTGGDTELLVLDIPLIGDSDEDYGVYLTGGGGDNWSEASIYVSTDNSNYQFATTLETYGTYGTCSTFISTTVEVVLSKGELESVTTADIVAGFNKALVGEEIIQFETATLTAPNTYTLSDLVRGLRGTESVSHTSNERFVLLTGDDSYIIRLPGTASDIGETRYFKALSPGQSLDQVDPVSLVIEGNALKPYSPALAVATKDEANNITISWTRRDRHAGERTDYIKFPLSDAPEEWEIEIYLSTTLKRTITTTSSTAIYSRENQILDFGSIQSNISGKIYQLSPIVGRGTPLTVTLTPTFSAATPTITSFSPMQGLSGTTVTVTGSGLSGVTAVSINGLSQSSLTVISDSSLTFVIAASTTTGLINLTAPGGTANSSAAFVVATASLAGHVIKDEIQSFTQRANLKFTGGVTVTDDSANDATVIDITEAIAGASGTFGTVSKTTASLAQGASENADLTIAAISTIRSITADKQSRIRMFGTSAARTADSANVSTQLSDQSNLILDIALASGSLTYNFAKGIVAHNLDSTISNKLYAKIFNNSGSSGTVAVDIKYYAIASITTDPILLNLLAYWKFEETSGNRLDNSGNSLTLVENGGTISSTTGKINNAANFVSANSRYLEESETSSLFNIAAADYTISFWVYYNSNPATANARYLSKETSPSGRGFGLTHSGGNLVAVVGKGDTNRDLINLIADSDLTLSTWLHILITHTASTKNIKGFLNGTAKLNGNYTGTPANVSTKFTVGGYTFNSNRGGLLDGRLDEIAIWTRVLDTSEIASLYNAGSGYSLP